MESSIGTLLQKGYASISKLTPELGISKLYALTIKLVLSKDEIVNLTDEEKDIYKELANSIEHIHIHDDKSDDFDCGEKLPNDIFIMVQYIREVFVKQDDNQATLIFRLDQGGKWDFKVFWLEKECLMKLEHIKKISSGMLSSLVKLDLKNISNNYIDFSSNGKTDSIQRINFSPSPTSQCIYIDTYQFPKPISDIILYIGMNRDKNNNQVVCSLDCNKLLQSYNCTELIHVNVKSDEKVFIIEWDKQFTSGSWISAFGCNSFPQATLLLSTVWSNLFDHPFKRVINTMIVEDLMSEGRSRFLEEEIYYKFKDVVNSMMTKNSSVDIYNVMLKKYYSIVSIHQLLNNTVSCIECNLYGRNNKGV